MSATVVNGARNLAAVRRWWREQHPPPSLGHRLELLYTTVLVSGIFGLMAYGTASAALAQVVTPDWVARYGPSLVGVVLLAVARWGAYQGPVVFSLPDVAHLLGAPLPRRGLVARRLGAALGVGALGGVAVAGVILAGLAGDGRGLVAGQTAGVIAGCAGLGVLAVAGTWLVERSAAWERLARRATWPVIAGMAALAVLHPGSGVGPGGWFAALGLVLVAAAVSAAGTLGTAADCPLERHARRAEAHASAIASLASFDARTARQAVERVGAPAVPARSGGLPRLRAAIAARDGGRASATAIVWRDAVAAQRAPGQLIEAAVLAGTGTALALANVDRPLVVAATTLLVYLGASRMLATLRAELDVTDRARVLLRPRVGRTLRAHTVVPALVTTTAASLGALACALAGAVPGPAVIAVALLAAPIVTLCAARSARRGGRLPYSVLSTAVAADPSGGGLALISWGLSWPALAVAAAGVPLLLAAGGGAGPALALAWTAAAGAVLAHLAGSEPESHT